MEEEQLKQYLKAFKEGYLEELENEYDHLNKKEKRTFPFFKSYDYLGIQIFNVSSIDRYRKFVILITNNIENKYIEVPTNKEIRRYKANFSSRNDIGAEVVRNFYPDLELDKKPAYHLSGIFTIGSDLKINFLKNEGARVLRKHYDEIKEHKNQKISKNKKPKPNPFSFLDFDSLIEKVDDDDFEYQMNEAKKCYENQLYLAACCTFSVCLETVLMNIIEKHNLKVNEDSTMLNKLGDTLREKGIISKRANNRLLITYSVRNATSHTNKNKVIQNDCEWILKTIEFFIDEF